MSMYDKLETRHAHTPELYKLRPMITELNDFKQESANSRTQSIDECMVKFEGRSSLKQYMPKKPIKRGLDIYINLKCLQGKGVTLKRKE